MENNFDYIVVGSGFGGSVMALRLVEKGYRVLLLERGRQWGMHEFPRSPADVHKSLFWDPQDNKYGLMEVRNNPESDLMSVTASGLGGGSLIYANVLLKMPTENFQGWPKAINRPSLEKHYDTVLKMMNATPLPFATDSSYASLKKTTHFSLLKESFQKDSEVGFVGQGYPPLAVNFNGRFLGHQTINEHGAVQSKCNNCGQCDIGCNIHAKNTLDLNYLTRAQNVSLFKNPLEIKLHHQVIEIVPGPNGYTVKGIQQVHAKKTNFEFSTKCLVLSAGSIGSTELLLKNRKNGNLPKLNNFLGKKICGNGDFPGVALSTDRVLEPTRGPVITSYLNFKPKIYNDNFISDIYIQDAGYPVGLAWYLSGKVPQTKTIKKQIKLVGRFIWSAIKRFFKIEEKNKFEVNIGNEISNAIDRGLFIDRSMLLLGMGRDRSDGIMELSPNDEGIIKWDETLSRPHFDHVAVVMKKISEFLGGVFLKNPIDFVDKIITVHPLGGCPMGEDSESGFVNTSGQVFNYPGLYIVDGSIIPASTGPNPSLTIAAVAEFIAEQIKEANDK